MPPPLGLRLRPAGEPRALPVQESSDKLINRAAIISGTVPARRTKEELFDEFARIGQALASGRRIEIIDVLANGERTVESLAAAVGLSVANASQHLQVLRACGLVSSRRQGTFVHYRLASPSVFTFWAALRALAAERSAAVERLISAYVGPLEELEPIGRDELLERLRSREPPLLLDVRPVEEYEAAHLPGAISLPLPELEHRLQQLPRDRLVVAYCRGPCCALAPEAVRLLRRRGYRARPLEEGLPEWVASGLPVEGSGRTWGPD